MGILLICIGILAISVNDLLIKLLSGGYPLHQMVFVRSAIGLIFTFGFLFWEGGFGLLKTRTPGLHLLRGLLVVGANMTFYAAVAVLPLGQATALFFVAPLFITLLSIPILGEKVGPLRLSAVVVGFLGVVLMQEPWKASVEVSRWVLLLPVIAAGLYAFMQVLTRRLGVSTRASALAVYIQSTFLMVSVGFFLVAGDGRYAEGVENESLIFLLKAWSWPTPQDWPVFIGLGLCSGIIGYCLSAAYRMASAATIAPFEYIGLPLAIFWGWVFFAEWPTPATWAGCALIIGAGLFVFLREKQKNSPMPGWRRRWGRR
jgi:S-adenosylmethionine uptake transporter